MDGLEIFVIGMACLWNSTINKLRADLSGVMGVIHGTIVQISVQIKAGTTV
ncbi:hypothetical protein [Dyadobacter sp. 3J3]|uniref:hypothetical protein n=1 Tax=Dyadobacter sp. 3J3 TaxID=2606600 RepID=UPI001359B601|nr:hypothetical protein [Dyadobacter sp. 3J3]